VCVSVREQRTWLALGSLPLIKGDFTEPCVQPSKCVNAIKELVTLQISAFPICSSGGGVWGFGGLVCFRWVFFCRHIIIVRKIPVDDRLSVCLCIREKEGKLNHLSSWRANPKQGLLGNHNAFGKTETF